MSGLVICSALLPGIICAQQNSVMSGPPPNNAVSGPAQPAGEVKPLTNEQVVSLVKSGASDDTVISLVEHSPAAFDTSLNALMDLHEAGVGNAVINAIRARMAKDAQAAGSKSGNSAVAETTKVAVMDFKTIGESSDLGEGAAEILRTTLMDTGKYVVIERDMLKQVLEEQKLGLSGIVEPKTAAGIGRILGASLVAVGSVVKTGETYSLNVRFVSVETGAVVFAKRLTTRAQDGIPNLCGQVVQMLAKGETSDTQAELYPESAPVKEKIVSAPKKPAASGSWALGLVYPGAAVRYQTRGSMAWELKAQAGSGIFIAGTRLYYHLASLPGISLFCGAEGDYIGFKGKVSKGSGFASGAFVGGGVLLAKQLSLSMDFGPMYMSLGDSKYSESASGVDYIINMGIYWHFI